ncbi:MAG: hypothetical protein U0324_46055 [Polyangiales bacterium]
MAHRDVPDPPRALRGAFTGRAEELAVLAAWHRGGGVACVLRGVAGVGKTRLAREFAGRHGGGVFVEVGEASPESLAASLAEALGVELPSADLLACYALLGAALDARGEALVVLDACESAPQSVCALWDVLARVAPRARWLCTAQRAPGLAGELVVEVGPLTDDDARALFALRVEERREALTAHDLRALPALLARLDRVPLAIELAAARVGLLDVASLAARFASGSGALDGALRGSWAALSPEERRALRAVALFPAPVTAVAAERVLAPAGDAALDLLQALVARSWLNVRVSPDGARLLVMLDQVRAFVCAEEPADPAAVHAFVADHLALARRVRGVTWRNDWPALMSVACGAAESMRAAVRLAPSPDEAAEIALALAEVSELQGLFLRTRSVVDEAAPRCASASPSLVFALGLARVSCERYGGAPAEGLGRLEALDPLFDAAAPTERALYCNVKSTYLRASGRFEEALTWARRGAAIASDAGLRAVAANVALSVGAALWQAGDREGAFAMLEGAWRDAATAGSPAVEASAALNHGELLLDRGRLPEAACALAAAEGAAERLRLQRVGSLALQRRGLVELELGHVEAAGALIRAAEAKQRELGLRIRWVECLGAGVFVAMAAGRWREAGARCDEALAAAAGAGSLPVIAQALRLMRAVALHATGERDAARAALAEVRDDDLYGALAAAIGRALAGEATGEASGYNERMLLRLARRAAEAAPARAVLRVQVAGAWFERAGGGRVSLAGRPVVARVLAALAAAPEGVDVDGLLAAGWPGERTLGSSGAARVYDVVRTLRKLGLGDAIVREGGRYRLHPAEPVERVG